MPEGFGVKLILSLVIVLSGSVMLLAGCTNNQGGFRTSGTADIPSEQGGGNSGAVPPGPAVPTPAPTPVVDPNPGPSPTPPVVPPPVLAIPLLWEAVRSESRAWSQFVFSLVGKDLRSMLSEVKDMERFCPNYAQLTESEKVNAFGMLVSGISKYESDFDPLMRYHETTMGTDPVTGLPVYSEGLLQLSYQDVTGWPFCKFNWNKDKNLAVQDPRKTILDPFNNLDCGVRILAEQIHRTGKVVINASQGGYWATILQGGRYEKINEIAQLMQSALPFCRRSK